MNKAQRKYVADFEANMTGKTYNIFDCISFATDYNQIDPTPDPEYIVLLGNTEVNRFESLKDADNYLLNTIKNCFYLTDHRLVGYEVNFKLQIEHKAGDNKTQILTYVIVKEGAEKL